MPIDDVAMKFDAGTWWLIAILAGAAIAAISYFLKRTITKVDEHDKDIQTIKQTYVTKDEFKDLRTEIKTELVKISGDMDDMKKTSLSKTDFYRAQSDTNDNIKRIYDLLIKINGGGKQNGQ